MSVNVAVSGYLNGHVPYGVADEIVWRVPAPRYYLHLEHARFPTKVWRRTAQSGWTVRVNHDFEQVVRGCAEAPRPRPTSWITPNLRRMYSDLHTADLACSFEVWDGDHLIAGEFGVLIGGAYFGESKFHRVGHAGNLCTGAAVLTLASAGFTVYDVQNASAYHQRFSTRPLEPFGDDVFATTLAWAARKRFAHAVAGGRVTVSPPVLPRQCAQEGMRTDG